MPKQGHLYQATIVVLLLAVGRGVVAGDGKRSPESDLAAPGAPLYEKAVKESVITLMSKQEQAALDAQGRPPSPGPDYFWCKNCKTYHKRQTPASPGQPAVAQSPAAAPAASPQPAAAAARPPSPGADYYWCENCKTYHKRQAAPNQHGAAVPGTPALQEAPAAGSGVDVRPPSPGEGYYWCENCKTYHKRQAPAPAQQPGASPSAPHVSPPETRSAAVRGGSDRRRGDEQPEPEPAHQSCRSGALSHAAARRACSLPARIDLKKCCGRRFFCR